MLEIKKHMKKILAISAASLVGVTTVVSSILPYDSAYAEGTGSTSVLKVTVDGDGSVSVNTGSREYTATEKKAFEKRRNHALPIRKIRVITGHLGGLVS